MDKQLRWGIYGAALGVVADLVIVFTLGGRGGDGIIAAGVLIGILGFPTGLIIPLIEIAIPRSNFMVIGLGTVIVNWALFGVLLARVFTRSTR